MTITIILVVVTNITTINVNDAMEPPSSLDHLITGWKTSDTEGEQNPTPGVAVPAGVLRQLAADLAVNLISAGPKFIGSERS